MDEFTMASMTPLPVTTWIVIEGFGGLVNTHVYYYTRFHNIDELVPQPTPNF